MMQPLRLTAPLQGDGWGGGGFGGGFGGFLWVNGIAWALAALSPTEATIMQQARSAAKDLMAPSQV
jgi:hypothetical protein